MKNNLFGKSGLAKFAKIIKAILRAMLIIDSYPVKKLKQLNQHRLMHQVLGQPKMKFAKVRDVFS